MRTQSKILAIVFVVIGFLALIGAIFHGATWHYGTAALCAVLVWLFYSDSNLPQNPGVSIQ